MMHTNAPATGHTRFPMLRTALREDMLHYSDDQLVEAAFELLPSVDLDDLEINFGAISRSLGPALSKVGTVAGQAAPGALSGAMSGATMGAALGPYGMLAGAALGAIGGGVASYSQAQRQTATPQQNQPAQPQTQPTPQPSAARSATPVAPTARPLPAAPAPAISPATAQMLQLLSRPEVLQALMAVAAGAMGRQTTQVGARSFPTQSVADALEYAVLAAGNNSFAEVAANTAGGEAYQALMMQDPEPDHAYAQDASWADDAFADYSPQY